MSIEQQAPTPTCPACGNRILEKHGVFCPFCGTNMAEYAASANRPQYSGSRHAASGAAPQRPQAREVSRGVTTGRQTSHTQPTGLKNCPYCAEVIKAEAIFCKHCGRDLEPARVQQETEQLKPPRKWYRRTWFYVLTFLFLTPLWAIIVLDDPDQTTAAKVLATILMVVYVVSIGLWLAGA